MSPTAASLIAFVIILGGAFAGALLRNTLPGHHLADDAKDIVRLGAGLVGTIAALVLGLLIASAKSSYDTQSSQVQHMTADVVLLDRLLAQYGPEKRPIRELMRQAIGPLVERIWRENSAHGTKGAPFAATAASEEAFTKIGKLTPQTEAQRSLKARAIQLSTDFGADAPAPVRASRQVDPHAVPGGAVGCSSPTTPCMIDNFFDRGPAAQAGRRPYV